MSCNLSGLHSICSTLCNVSCPEDGTHENLSKSQGQNVRKITGLYLARINESRTGQRLCSVSASIRAGPPQVSDNGVSLDRTADTEQYNEMT